MTSIIPGKRDNLLYSLPVSILVNKEQDLVIINRGVVSVSVPGFSWGETIEKIFDLTSEAISTEELKASFDEKAFFQIESLLRIFLKNNFLFSTKSDIQKDDKENLFYWHFNISSKQARKDLSVINIVIVGINTASLELAKTLILTGITNISFLSDPLLDEDCIQLKDHNFTSINKLSSRNITCIIAVAPENQKKKLMQLNKQCIEMKVNFFPVLINNLKAYIGPYVVPPHSPCFFCFMTRLYSNIENFDLIKTIDLQSDTKSQKKTNGIHPCAINFIVGALSIRLINIFMNLRSQPANTVMILNLVTGESKNKKVIKVPYCDNCGI